MRQKRAGKYNNKPTEVDGIKFHSQKEARYYSDLKIRVRLGEVEMFLMQVPFHLPGGVKYVADFLEFRSDETVVVIDVKGVRTDQYKTKKKLVEFYYPVTVVEA
ncbi:hypothetical protein GZ77_26230 [Endozoicomonas montiporae]|uniref:DUF1064 domain-containing protein n=1 Tax=Endozoicomonas montiporae TaxID=1027273 RepID=A0A081MYN3_9GAMM|nr:hypothetical protein GZ77_26445 [Endozoicomonas montiporae]KEQ11306.1 hypothetical protein GZ77_26230 [Endozoicomonas montiporae]